MEKIIIIGGVAGGASCAARLRRLNESATIILLEKGPYVSYANCGLPYHVGDTIQSRNALLLQTPELMKIKSNIDARVNHEVLSIIPEEKIVKIKDLNNHQTYNESYDKLVISTGSSPLRPSIKGINHPRIKTLWTVSDADEIRKITQSGIQSVAVIGGGFIGLEMVENLAHLGLDVTLIEGNTQVLSSLDFEMAQLLHEQLRKNRVTLHLNNTVTEFIDNTSNVGITLQNGTCIDVDLVILAIGVCPNSELAKNAGLTVNEMGGIVVTPQMQTSNLNIWAVGDVIEVEDFIFHTKTMIPLAGPANKQGRIVANLLSGKEDNYTGSQGTSILKLFQLSAASTGANERRLKSMGLVKGIDFQSCIVTQNCHASYYPGATPLTIKLLFPMDGSKLYGAQIVGYDGVDKRIDTLAVALRLGATISQLTDLEFAYAPPFSSAKDPVNMVGFVAQNILDGLTNLAQWDEIEQNKDAIVLDVREQFELTTFSLPNAVHIPLGQIRTRISELNPSQEYIILCGIGVRAHNASCILKENGFQHLKVYPGGARFYQSTHHQAMIDPLPLDCSGAVKALGSGGKHE